MVPQVRNTPLGVSQKEPKACENKGVEPSNEPNDRGKRGSPSESACGERNDVHRDQSGDGQFLNNDRQFLGRWRISLNYGAPGGCLDQG